MVAAVVLRVVVALASVVFGGLMETADPEDVDPVAGTGFSGWEATGPEEQGWGAIGAGLERYDALWYLALARDGYPEPTTENEVPAAYAFFPLFPLVVSALGWLLFGRLLLAANIVVLVATVIALAGVHRLVETETGDRALAGRALLVTAAFPASFFLVAPYTEALFLATSVWTLVLARERRWEDAGALALLAGLTRGVGGLLSVALALEAWRQHREDRPPGWRALLAVLGAPVGLGLYLAYAAVRTGSPLAPLLAQNDWDRSLTLPTHTLAFAWSTATGWIGEYPVGYHTLDLLLFVVIAAGVLWLLARVPAPYSVYALAHVVVWLITPFPGRPLMSTYRFALAIAPLPWAFAAWTKRPGALAVWCAVSGMFAGAMLLAFVNWYFVM